MKGPEFINSNSVCWTMLLCVLCTILQMGIQEMSKV